MTAHTENANLSLIREPVMESINSPTSSIGSVSTETTSLSSTSDPSSASSVPGTGDCDLKRSHEVFLALVRILQDDTHYIDALKASIVEALEANDTLKKPTACSCLALGAVNQWEDPYSSTIGLAQLVVLTALLEAFGIDRSGTTVADPGFREEDVSFLRSLNFNASVLGFGTEAEPDLPVLTEVTLAYHPGCSVAQLYERNWSPEGLSKIVTLEGTDRTLRQAVGRYLNFRVADQSARVAASTTRNRNATFVSAIEESVTERQEPSRRAMSISEEWRLPSLPSVDDLDNVAKLAPHFEAMNAETLQGAVAQTHTLCWTSEALLKRMPPAFWRLVPVVTKVSGDIVVDLEIIKSDYKSPAGASRDCSSQTTCTLEIPHEQLTNGFPCLQVESPRKALSTAVTHRSPLSVSSNVSTRSLASGASQTGYANFKRSREVFQQLVKILQHDTGYLDALKGSIVQSLNPKSTLKGPTACICLAVGAVNQWENGRQIWCSTVGLAQLIVLIALLDAFGIDRSRTTISDPRFREGDTLFLKSLGFSASTSAFGTEAKPNLPELKETTLVYNPGCSIAQLYQRNFTIKGLSRIITLQGTDCVRHQAVGKHANFRIDGQRAKVTASTSNNESPKFIAAIEESVSKAQERSRRALSISEENRLPAIHDFVKEGIKVNKLATHLGAIDARHIQYAVGQTHTLCWASESLLMRMPPAFWRIPKMVAKVSGNIVVDLPLDK